MGRRCLLALVLASAACGEADLNELVEPDALAVAFDVQPTELDLGTVAVGERATTTLAVTNTGEADLIIAEVAAPEHMHLDLLVSAPSVAAGETQIVTVGWEPAGPGLLSTEVALTLGPSLEGLETVRLPVRGSARGAALAVSVDDFDFGEVSIGCTGNLNVTVSNAGNEPLVIDALWLEGDQDFELRNVEALPWTLPPFGSSQVTVRYQPDDLLGNLSTLWVRSDVGSAPVSLEGVGIVDGEERIEVVVAERKPAVILFHVGPPAIYGGYWEILAERFDQALPTFFQALQDSRVDYRVAFLWNDTGTIDGDYIDRTVSVRSAHRRALNQIAGGGGTNNNDFAFTTFLNALRGNTDWMFEDDYWSSAKVSLISINNDDDRSPIPASSAVKEAQSYKESDDDLVFHGIGVPPTGGTCGVPFGPYKDAIDLTDGVHLDVCVEDWDDHMLKLVANSVVGGRESGRMLVPLKGTPLVSSIRVELDGENMPANWVYEAATNAVVFDLEFAFDGRNLAVTYLGSNVCGSG